MDHLHIFVSSDFQLLPACFLGSTEWNCVRHDSPNQAHESKPCMPMSEKCCSATDRTAAWDKLVLSGQMCMIIGMSDLENPFDSVWRHEHKI